MDRCDGRRSVTTNFSNEIAAESCVGVNDGWWSVKRSPSGDDDDDVLALAPTVTNLRLRR
jgi:hypothetical protein